MPINVNSTNTTPAVLAFTYNVFVDAFNLRLVLKYSVFGRAEGAA